jgi:pyruvate/2-oxoglutarate dehydrogenase complex dihydrolipoamide acyltransferase (E2) component
MSLEQAIQENTAAIKALIAALGTGATSQAAAPAETTTVEEPKAEKPTKEKKQSAPAATPESKEDTAAAADEPAPVSYDDCAQSVTKLAKSKGRPAAVALLGQFDLKTLQDAKDKPVLLAQVKAAADAELGE